MLAGCPLGEDRFGSSTIVGEYCLSLAVSQSLTLDNIVAVSYCSLPYANPVCLCRSSIFFFSGGATLNEGCLSSS
eukprot:CAMPEP_0202969212 /NCGR_PEP_ID=MMETSP1396-20130829/14847_1 /ASSEMBLY_ACC=CAM_ASM_000872 /TAXON_ID= /ORGANISM="Pseudokeronopsis sp., Strain Brazil" /LENGTH=74 /DNA_ID=CAMNT_0049696475 /DNA_START=282 /DNA_END=503 /DNA_ORIENTATION=-